MIKQLKLSDKYINIIKELVSNNKCLAIGDDKIYVHTKDNMELLTILKAPYSVRIVVWG